MDKQKLYKILNNSIGWIVGITACIIYVMTAERTTSWWDCGEYISTAFKLQIGHPPGAPTFQLIGRLFSLLSGGDIMVVGWLINSMSAICSGLSILFLFWTITLLAKKIVAKNGEMSLYSMVVILGSALVGSLAYTFSDSFWFSAVEGEVYAMSSFFTAITFWSILKWEEQADSPNNLRWLVLISLLIGLSIGVHLLNLLAIPAVVFVVYYKKFKSSRKGFWLSTLISVVLLGLILWVIVPMIVSLAGKFDVFFVNVLGTPFNTGTFVYFAILIGLIVFLLWFSIKKKKVILNTIVLCFTFLLIGYSTFFILVIRANAAPPINENEPKTAASLLDYLNREQYGSRPLFYGQYFTAKNIGVNEGSMRYTKDDELGEYREIGRPITYKYDPRHCGLFPRMYSSEEGRYHVTYYKFWSGTPGNRKPNIAENMTFLFKYQIGWQWYRYFMWNFVGRQNNIQGKGYDGAGNRDVLHGNWISGIKFIDAARLGPQDNLPADLANNQARNTYYFLPLLLGLVGLVFQYFRDRKGNFIVFLLFFMTGIAIILYLNQPSIEPRERDYSVVGSFYAFCIWIGLGVMAIAEGLKKIKKFPAVASAGIATVACFFAVPYLMANENWDDHDRSNMRGARDFARNSLLSCDENAILICNGDNDTFPVWFCQEVENVRTDVRVVNSALAGSYWHVMPLFNKVYESDPLPLTLQSKDYAQGVNDQVFMQNRNIPRTELKQLLQFIASDNSQTKVVTQDGREFNYIPTNLYFVKTNRDNLLQKGLITAEQYAATPENINFDLNASGYSRSDLVFLDMLGSFNFERPIFVTSPYAQKSIWPIKDFAELNGVVHKFVPYYNVNRNQTSMQELNGINTERSYDLFMNQFSYGNLAYEKTYIDPESFNNALAMRADFIYLAQALIFENKNDKAVEVLDKCLEVFPNNKIAFDRNMCFFVQTYISAGAEDKAVALAETLTDIFTSNIKYFSTFPNKYQRLLQEPTNEAFSVLYNIYRFLPESSTQQATDVRTRIAETLKQHGML